MRLNASSARPRPWAVSLGYVAVVLAFLAGACGAPPPDEGSSPPLTVLETAPVSATSSPPPPARSPATPPTELARGEAVRSSDGATVLVHQHDGNVVLYDASRPVWHAATHGAQTSILAFQPDGNVVLYAPDRATPVWSTRTHGRAQDGLLAVQDDANLVIYAADHQTPVWAIRGMTPPTPPPGTGVPPLLRKIGWCEAGAYIGLPRYQTNYRAYNQQGSSASGGYQILDGTWRSWRTLVQTDPPATSFARAAHAPPHVQDQVATAAFNRYGSSPWNASRSCWG